jgi:hypothetical protein
MFSADPCQSRRLLRGCSLAHQLMVGCHLAGVCRGFVKASSHRHTVTGGLLTTWMLHLVHVRVGLILNCQRLVILGVVFYTIFIDNKDCSGESTCARRWRRRIPMIYGVSYWRRTNKGKEVWRGWRRVSESA